MKRYLIIITLLFNSLIVLCQKNQVKKLAFTAILNNPKKSTHNFIKQLKNKELSDSLKNDFTYKLAISYYQKGLSKSNNTHFSRAKKKQFSTAKGLFEQLETKRGYRINSLFRKGLCDIGLFQFDSAYYAFSKVIILNPLISEAYYFKAMSYAFSYSKKDTAEYYKLVEEMNSVIQITEDTVTLLRIAKATNNLKKVFPCRVFDSHSYPKVGYLSGVHQNTYALEVSGGIYDLDTAVIPILNKSLYDLWGKVKLFYWDFETEDYQEKIMPYEDFMTSKDIHSIIEIPDSISIQSFELSAIKELPKILDEKDKQYSENHKMIDVICSSSNICNGVLEEMKGLTYLDKIYIESIKTSDLEKGFISPCRGSILLDTRLPRYFKKNLSSSKVTLNDQFNGASTKTELIARPYLKIQENEAQWKIIDYELAYLIRGETYSYTLDNTAFPPEAIAGLYKLQNGSKVFVDYIRAVNKWNDTCYLNSIAINIKPEPKYTFTLLDTNLTEGQKYLTSKIFFNRYVIKQESYPLLDSLVLFLKKNRSITLEIEANGLLKGEEFSSEQDSKKRAESICDYFSRKGINRMRLIPKGYGDTKQRISIQQIDSVKTEEEKQALKALNFYMTFKVMEEKVNERQIFLEESLGGYAQKIDLNSKDTSSYNNRGLTKIKLQDYKGAIEDYNIAIRLNPKCDTSYTRRGYCKYMLGSAKDALIDYNKALILNPKYIMVYNNIGVYYADIENYNEAIKVYDKAITYSSQDTLIYYNRGVSKEGLKDYQGALQDYDKAIELGAKDSDVYSNRKRVKNKLKIYERKK